MKRSILLLVLALAACAGERWTYLAPAGIPDDTLQRDQRACADESSIVRLSEDQLALEQRCMMDRGYTLRREP